MMQRTLICRSANNDPKPRESAKIPRHLIQIKSGVGLPAATCFLREVKDLPAGPA